MKFSSKRRNLLRVLWGMTVVLVIAGSLLPATSLPMRAIEKLPLNDKALHFLAYAVLAFLPALHESRRAVAWHLAAVLLLGVAIEFAQSYSIGRFSEVADAVANGWGALCGLIVGVFLRS